MRCQIVATLALALLGTLPVRAGDPPPLSGSWTLNKELSGDIEARIKDAAGSQYMSSGHRSGVETWLPWGAGGGEGERVEVRAFLLAAVPALSHLQLELTPAEVKTVHGEAGARIFSLTRKNAGTSAVTGETVQRQAHWKGEQLILETRGKDSHLTEAVTPVPARRQITYALRYEAKVLEKPLDLSLVYDRAAPQDR
jgi:hypothetical protein